MKTLKNSAPNVVSIFTGAGGMDEGFKAAGFDVRACMDIEEWACDTLRANNEGQLVIGPPQYSGDIKAISPEEFSEISGLKKGEIDVLIGGPPCQPFSQAASQRFFQGDERFKRKGFEDQEKGTLLFDFVNYIKWFRPTVFVIENVAGLLTIDNGEQLDKVLSELRELGYRHTFPETVNAVDYGVPQYRERLIVWGTLNDKVEPQLPRKTHGTIATPHNVVANVLSDIPTDCVNHVLRAHKEESVARYKTLDFGQREKKGRVDRLDPLKPSKTVIAGGMNGGGRSHLHPFVARTISVRECARLQTFRDDFVFHGSIARQFTQVGNAVPPLLSEHFAREILTSVFGRSVPKELVHSGNIKISDRTKLAGCMLKNAVIEKPEWIYFTHEELVSG
ncbi:DNA cytosine methyltransferase [Vibrio crassostreae]|uniref:DNA cytosine methyltransferase n=1 Tax=Vibrio crassostreae TaxID=246167 RepID=UPI001B30D2E1|nr:DNA cytosine methyltransferase [Vibrio crassostreae]